MARVLYCIPCALRGQETLSSVVIDGDPMCKSCARDLEQGYIAKAAEAAVVPADYAKLSVELCGQGCGHPKHRGRCKGYGGRTHEARQRMAEIEEAEARADAVSAAEAEKKESGAMDTLKSREIALEEIPVASETVRIVGRMGQLWMWLRDAKPTAALEVVCRDRVHLGSTHRPLRKKAKAAGIGFYWSAVGSTYYISKTAFRGSQKAWE